jgi:para-nitrobenzyl esterase
MPKYMNISMSEDCLSLQVHAPSTPSSTPRPVMLFIHGGSFLFGFGWAAPGENLAAEGDVVVVTINYRLGALGWYASDELRHEDPDHASGALNGMRDQRVAMQWVRDNINLFGGDAANVTIFGESAGALSVCSHSVSPASKGLFRRAIVESGPCIGPWGPIFASDAACTFQYSQALERAVNASTLPELRALPASALTCTESESGRGPACLHPMCADGFLFKDELPPSLYQKGAAAINPEQIVFGANSLDTLLAPPWGVESLPSTAAEFAARISATGVDAKAAAAIEAQYDAPSKYGGNYSLACATARLAPPQPA